MITNRPDIAHVSRSADGKILVDPDYAAKNPAWLGLIKASVEVEEIAQIGRTPFSAVTREQALVWERHILTKVACEPDGVHMLEIFARWLQQYADRMAAPEGIEQ